MDIGSKGDKMATKQELYGHFGPQLLDALVRTIRKRDLQIINKLNHIAEQGNKVIEWANSEGMSPEADLLTDIAALTSEQIVNAIAAEYDDIRANGGSWEPPDPEE